MEDVGFELLKFFNLCQESYEGNLSLDRNKRSFIIEFIGRKFVLKWFG